MSKSSHQNFLKPASLRYILSDFASSENAGLPLAAEAAGGSGEVVCKAKANNGGEMGGTGIKHCPLLLAPTSLTVLHPLVILCDRRIAYYMHAQNCLR